MKINKCLFTVLFLNLLTSCSNRTQTLELLIKNESLSFVSEFTKLDDVQKENYASKVDEAVENIDKAKNLKKTATFYSEDFSSKIVENYYSYSVITDSVDSNETYVYSYKSIQSTYLDDYKYRVYKICNAQLRQCQNITLGKQTNDKNARVEINYSTFTDNRDTLINLSKNFGYYVDPSIINSESFLLLNEIYTYKNNLYFDYASNTTTIERYEIDMNKNITSITFPISKNHSLNAYTKNTFKQVVFEYESDVFEFLSINELNDF